MASNNPGCNGHQIELASYLEVNQPENQNAPKVKFTQWPHQLMIHPQSHTAYDAGLERVVGLNSIISSTLQTDEKRRNVS